MDAVIALLAAFAATLFALDLSRDYLKRRRPHTAAYAAGIGMFAAATWALWVGLAFGWSGPAYRVFFLLGAVLNIPTLAIGSMFLVVGKKSGHAMTLFTGALAAISTTLVSTVPFARELPVSGLAEDLFPPISDGFGPRLLAAIGSGSGALLLILLAVASAVRFWNSDRRIVKGNALIVAGTLAGSTGGTLLGFLGETEAFEVSLLATVTLIWWGYRVTRRKRSSSTRRLAVVGPSSDAAGRERAESLLSALEAHGFVVTCPARDQEQWGEVGFTASEQIQLVFDAIDRSEAVVADLAGGLGVEMAAGYARAATKPFFVAAPEGRGISRELRGAASDEIYYASPIEVVSRIQRFFDAIEE